MKKKLLEQFNKIKTKFEDITTSNKDKDKEKDREKDREKDKEKEEV
jgi:hypothetical protein